MHGLMGPNGSGKTTQSEFWGGVLPVEPGAVRRDGRPLTPRERAAILFYLPDAIAPWPAQPVRWALDFLLRLFGGRASLRADVGRRLDLEPLLDVPMGTLSTGQRKRALLPIGLIPPQPVLLSPHPLDRPDL